MHFLKGRLAIKILRSKLFYWTTIPALVLGALVLVYYSNVKDFPVFPNPTTFNYNFYSDSAAGGSSKILNKVISDSLLQVDFQISNKISTPYAGISMGPKASRSINIGNYNQLTIKVKGDEINGVGIALVTRNSFKAKDQDDQGVLFYHIFKISPGIHTYKISIDKFEVPDWWGENNRMEDASAIKPDLRSLEAINVSSAFTDNTGKIQSIGISSIAFSRNNTVLVNWIIAFELGWILLAFISFYGFEKTREKKQTITINYQPIENKPAESSKSSYIAFINSHFQNSELTLDLVSHETGVSQRRITNEIQVQFECNFKTYINRLRINESKRLLMESDLNIGEIAFKVGFNNQSHFNRVFKSELQISPTEYRDQHKI